MNLQRRLKGLSTDGCAGRIGSGKIYFGQNVRAQLESTRPFMFLSFARRAAIYLCLGLFLGLPAAVFGQTNYYSKNGTEYSVVGSLAGDQVFPDAVLTGSGGFVVWQDNATDGSGWGVSARRLDGTLSGTLGTFRVNAQGADDQKNPRVALLKNGGAVFAWQGGSPSHEQIYARFLTSSNTWLTTNDVLVNTPAGTNVSYSYSYLTNTTYTIKTNWDRLHRNITGYTTNSASTVTTITNAMFNTLNFRINPAIATLNNSNVVVVWASFDQAGSNSLQDVYAKILSPAGQTISNEFLVNQFTSYNQRTPAVAALKNGGFVVAWVSEQQRLVAPNLGANTSGSTAANLVAPSVDIFARIYAGNGAPAGAEFLVNAGVNPCANPAVAVASDGGFMVGWSAFDMQNRTNSQDIYARPFSSAGVGGSPLRVNSYLPGDQYGPRLSAIGADYMVVWTSLGQDGSREGVFGQFVHNDGSPVGGEFQVNTTTVSMQMQPVVASDGAGQFLVVWTGFNGSPNSFDLFAQRYLNVAALLQPMAAPFVYAPFNLDAGGNYQPQLQVSWPPLLGISVSNYLVFVDGSGVPAGVTPGNVWTMTVTNGLAASSTHSFQVEYVTSGGSYSPISAAAAGSTWSGGHLNGIPVEWLEQYYGNAIADWPANVNAPLAPGGLTLRQVFQSGGSPLDAGTWLRTSLSATDQGMFLGWNTLPGQTYQVQTMSGSATWTNLGAPRFAAGAGDSILVGGGSAGYYRVLLLRQ